MGQAGGVRQTEREANMRRVDINTGGIRDPAAKAAIQEIASASAEVDLIDIAAAFTIEGAYTETRTLHVGTSRLAETQAFIATLIEDFKRGGQHRTN
jgi:hypothetical protein